MSGRGFFLVLEGVEGAGKTTQARLLSRWLEERAIPHRVAREPGGTPVGEAIRRMLLDARGVEIPAETELLLMLAARAAFVRDVVRPTLERGAVMVADRFELSTLAYQGLGRGLGLDAVRQLNAFATGGVRPDLTLLLDLPVPMGLARQADSGKVRDRIEEEGRSFLEVVREAYRTLAAQDDSVRVVEASGGELEIQRALQEILMIELPRPYMARRG